MPEHAPSAVAGPDEAVRHPLDPDAVRSTKATTVLALGIVAVITGPFVGGLVPAALALVLSGQARREAYRSGGYLTGAARVRRGERLAWVGIVLAATTLVIALVIGLFELAVLPGTQDFDSNVD